MKLVALLVILAVAFARNEKETQDQFIQFQHQFSKVYGSQEEFSLRYAVFRANLDYADEFNNRETGTATYGITKFMDLTPEEFTKYYKGARPIPNPLPAGEMAPVFDGYDALPTSYDWRDKNAVTAVYNQNQCGSCWAFSATETIESYHFLAGKPLTKLSMQQIVSCDTGDYGCDGGWTYTAYQYVESAGGLDTYASYPYTSGNGNNGECKFNKANIAASITGWQYVSQGANGESNMATFLYNNGPLSVCVDASSWQYYTGGVIGSSCGSSIDHCVQVTGFSVQNGKNAWNVRNSWGTDWGNNGYLYVQRGINACAIADVVTAVKE